MANDIVLVGKALAVHARQRIQEATGIPAAHVMITATHTHSGPKTVEQLSWENDPVDPQADPRDLCRLEDGIVEAAVCACRNARAARLGFAMADGSGVGSNRHDPQGPSDPQVPVVVVRDRDTSDYLALMVVCNMHATVLHEDTRLVSGDFPAATRQFSAGTRLRPELPGRLPHGTVRKPESPARGARAYL